MHRCRLADPLDTGYHSYVDLQDGIDSVCCGDTRMAHAVECEGGVQSGRLSRCFFLPAASGGRDGENPFVCGGQPRSDGQACGCRILVRGGDQGFVLAWLGAARIGGVARFYRVVRLVIDLLVLRCRRDRSKDVEIVVLRHLLAVLQRQIVRPCFEPEDRAILSAFARVLGRDRWSMFLVKPDTILGWHRRLVANHWTFRHRPVGAEYSSGVVTWCFVWRWS
jgi:hypothetical protein